MNPANAAQAIFLVSALAGLAIVGPLWLMYSSHCLLVMVTESSIGDREVRWPDETVADWWWKPLVCLGLLMVWVSTGAVLLSPFLLGGPWVYAGAAGLFLWYAYPIGLLSALDTGNVLTVLHMPLLVRLIQHGLTVFLVGLVTLPLAAIAGGLIAATVWHSTFWAVPAALVFGPALLLYGRSWGRLAWLVQNVQRGSRRAATEAPPPEAANVSVEDPWSIPPEETIPEVDVDVEEPEPAVDEEWSGSAMPYGVARGMPRTAPPTTAPPSPANSPKDKGGPERAVESPLFSNTEYYAEYRKREEERKARAEGRKPGEKRRRTTIRNAFGAGFWWFLIERRSIRVCLNLAALTLVLLILVRIALLIFGAELA